MQLAGQLPDGGGLAYAVHPDDEPYLRMMRLLRRLRLLPEHIRHELLHVRHDLPGVGNAPFRHTAPDLAHEIVRGAHSQIPAEQDRFQIIQKILVDLGIADDHCLNIFNQALFCPFQPFFDLVKKSHLNPP